MIMFARMDEEQCRSKLFTSKRKLYDNSDVRSPQKRIKISPDFSRCLNFWKSKENIHMHSGPADLTVRIIDKSLVGKTAKLSMQ